MRKIWVIAGREYRAAVKTKSFVVGIVLMPILMGGGFIAQSLLKGQSDLRPKKFVIVDRTPGGKVYETLEGAAAAYNQKNTDKATGKPKKAPFVLEKADPVPDADIDELRFKLSDRVRSNELTGFLEIGPKALEPPPLDALASGAAASEDDGPNEMGMSVPPRLEPYALRYQTNRPSFQDFPRWATTAVTAVRLTKGAGSTGVKTETLVGLVAPVPLVNKGLTTRDPQTGKIGDARDQNPIVAFLLPGGLVVLMFLLVLLGAAPLLQGLIEEKMQRIAEVLLGSVRPFELMMGKLLGMAGVSLTMGAVYLGGAYWAVHRYGYAELLTPVTLAWFLVYLVLAVFFFGSLYAAVGAACTDMKEAQAMLTPVTLVTMLPLFVWVNVVQEPTSTFATVASLFPPATPMLMVARQAIPPGIPWWQPALGVVLVAATTVLCVYVAGRIFRIGLLLQGNSPRFRDLARWVVQG